MSEIDLGIPGLVDVKEIGSGGFATVYVATQVDVGRRVAVKVLAAVDARGRRRFDRERRTMAQTTGHGNIVTLLESGYTDPGERPYLLMEHMADGSLQDRLDAHGPLELATAIDAITAGGEGLGFAHAAGIVHKDIKPANLLSGPTGVKLSDFGIASVRDSSGTSQVAYSLAYTAPETFNAARGPDGKVLDPRGEQSDLYSLAASLYALVTGEPPFTAESQATLIHQIMTEPPAPAGHQGLDRFFTTALAKDPGHRYPTTVQFLDALRAIEAPIEASHFITTEVTAAPRTADNPGQPTKVAAASYPVAGARAVRSSTQQPVPAVHSARFPPQEASIGRSPTNRKGGWRWLVAACALALILAGGGLAIAALAGSNTIATYSGHTDRVLSVVQLDNGNLASTSWDDTVQIWDPANPDTTIATYTGHADDVRSVIQLEDGNLATSSADGTVHIWDPAAPDVTIATYTTPAVAGTGQRNSVYSLIQLEDSHLATTSRDGAVRIWDPANPDTTIATYTGHTDDVFSVAELSNGNLASAGEDKTVQIWDPANPDTTIATYTGHSDVVLSVVQLDNGNVASTSMDDTVQIWDPANPDTTIAAYTGHTSWAWSVVQLDNGNLASTGFDAKVHIWDPTNPDRTIATYTDHTSNVRSIIQLNDGNLASTSDDNTVQIWDPANP